MPEQFLPLPPGYLHHTIDRPWGQIATTGGAWSFGLVPRNSIEYQTTEPEVLTMLGEHRIRTVLRTPYEAVPPIRNEEALQRGRPIDRPFPDLDMPLSGMDGQMVVTGAYEQIQRRVGVIADKRQQAQARYDTDWFQQVRRFPHTFAAAVLTCNICGDALVPSMALPAGALSLTASALFAVSITRSIPRMQLERDRRIKQRVDEWRLLGRRIAEDVLATYSPEGNPWDNSRVVRRIP